jgi:hypothetical protein
MKPDTENDVRGAGRIISYLTADRKKAVFVLCLGLVIIFMWMKVLLKKGPVSSQAAQTAASATDQQQVKNPSSKITFVDLPVVPGHHDVIERDFFNSHDWEDFINRKNSPNDVSEINVVSGQANPQEIKKVAEKLKLEAVWMGNKPQAYINNKLLKAADKLLISDGGKSYEFEVVLIGENEVVVSCNGADVMLTLPRETRNSK